MGKNLSLTRNNKWLILAYNFNMDGRAASQTITDRIPFLIAKGIDLLVLSAPNGNKDHRFPHYRVFSPAPSGLLFEMRRIIKKSFPDLMVQKLLKALLMIGSAPCYLTEKVFIHLDSEWSWFLSASVAGSFIIHQHRPSLIYSTGGPPSTHLTGFILSKFYRIPWLAEVHDPLIHDHDTIKWQFYLFKKGIETIIFKYSSALIYFTQKALDNARSRHVPRERTYLLRPGADPPSFGGVRYEKREKVHFGHFGILARDRNLGVVIQAFYQLIHERPDWKKIISLDIYGANLDEVSSKYLSDYPLDEVIHVHGRLEYDPLTRKSGRQQVMEAMRQCDVLLIVHGEKKKVCEEYIPSKLYEYLLTGRPILGVTSPSCELGKILIEQGHLVADVDELAKVKEKIFVYVLRWLNDGLPDHQKGSPFTVKAAVDNLVEIVDII